MTGGLPTPLVSVILPTYNRRDTLGRAIQSVLNQDYEAFELIVVDDGSTDDTADLVATIADPRVRFIRLDDNAGASRARNVGLRAAKGEFVAFQDSDDEWLHGKLAKQVSLATASAAKDVAVFHAKIIQGIDNAFRYGPKLLSYVPLLPAHPDDLAAIIRQRNVISPQTLLFARSCLDKVGYFDECLANSVDWDFAIRLIHNAEVIFLDEPLVMTYTQPNSISRNRPRAMRSQLRITLKLMRNYDIKRPLLSWHFGNIGMAITKLGKPRRGRTVLIKALIFNPRSLKNWIRLIVTQIFIFIDKIFPSLEKSNK